MKTAIFSAVALTLLQLVAASPHGMQHRHKRGVAVIVYVDGASGKVLSSVTTDVPDATPAPVVPSPSVPVNGGAFFASSSAPPAAVSSAPPVSDVAGGYGITYSAYKDVKGTGCKSADQIKADFAKMVGFGVVRVYDVGCPLADIIAAAKASNKKIFQGIYDLNKAQSDAAIIIKAYSSDWSVLHTVSVGNEEVLKAKQAGQDPGAKATQVAGAVGAVKSQLQGAGYKGPVVTVELLWDVAQYKQLCNAGDYIAVNCHPYFDAGGVAASGAGDYVIKQLKLVTDACPGKAVRITETGWPSAGDTHGPAIASPDQQTAAVASIKAAFKGNEGNVFLFSAFDEKWKEDRQYHSETHWGILN
ncbi:MAG: hypothetical protein M1814_001266 [Vezdaea aestivalis]|nr:MAG: hypothetical protein M1814_001266 [Vezdaea aestivalis]